MYAKIDCNRLTPFPPPKDCVVQSSFEITLFLLKHILRITVWQDYRIEGKIALHMAVSKLPGPSVSPPSLFSGYSLSNVLQTADGCKMQKRCDKMAKFGLQLAISQHLWV